MNKPYSFLYTLLSIVCLFFVAFFIFDRIGEKPLKEFDESIYAQVAVENSAKQSFLSFTWLGNQSMQKPWLGEIGLKRSIYWFEKPPLMLWTLMLTYSSIGVSEFSSRLPVGVFAFLTALVIGLYLYKFKSSPVVFVIYLSFFLLCFQYFRNAQILQFDIPVGFFILLSICSFYFARQTSQNYLLMWLFLTAGFLIKNVVGLLPVVIIFMDSLWHRDFMYLKNKSFYWGAFCFLLITIPWHWYLSYKFGHLFWDQYLFYHVLNRFNTILEHNSGSWNYYLNLILDHRLLTVFLIPSLIYFFYKTIKKERFYSLIFLGVISILVFFSLAKTKLSTYILVLYPWLALTCAVSLTDFLNWFFPKSFKIQFVLSLFLAMVSLGVAWRFHQYLVNAPPEQLAVDNKTLGLYLKNNHINKIVYNYSQIGTKPSIIFYSSRPIYFLPPGSPLPEKSFLAISSIGQPFPKSRIIHKTSTAILYLVNP